MLNNFFIKKIKKNKKSFSPTGFEPATHGKLQPLQSIALPTELQGVKILPAGLEPAASA